MSDNPTTGKQFRDCVVSVHPPHPERGPEIQINGRPIPIDEAVDLAQWILRAARPYSKRAVSLCGTIQLADAQDSLLKKLAEENQNG